MRAAILLVFVMCVSILRAEGLEDVVVPGEHPEEYDVLVNARSDEDVVPFIATWTNARKATAESINTGIQVLGRSVDMPDLTYDRLISTHLRGGARAENALCLDRRKEIAAFVILCNQQQREELANEMSYVDRVDKWVLSTFEPEHRESIAIVDQWVSVRATFAEDFAAKLAILLKKKSTFRVNANTVDQNTLPASGYEVMYVLELWEKYPKQHHAFPTFSTPTDEMIGPGLYVFYCRKRLPGGAFAEGPRRHLYITNDTPIHLLVP